MNKRISVGITAALILIAVTITFTATMIFAMNQFDSKIINSQKYGGTFDRLTEIDTIVQQYYYKDIDDNYLYDSVMGGYVEGLDDPYTTYLTAEEIALRNQQSRGTVVGVGLEVTQNADGYLYVNNVYSDSPADKVEMQQGDIIIAIDDQNVLDIGYEDASKLLYGVEGTKVVVEFQRGTDPMSVEMTYTTLEANTVSFAITDSNYYVRVKSMNDATPAQFTRAMREAQNAYITGEALGLIIDMRDLNGGYDRAVVSEMLTALMPRGTLYYGEYRDGTSKVLDTSDNDDPLNMPIAVLINERTSGYAELFAAVVSEKDNCRLVGTTTVGRGTLEELHMLSDGSGISLSVAILRTPSGMRFHETGVRPDFTVNTPDGFVLTSAPDESNDPQFKKAVEVLQSLR